MIVAVGLAYIEKKSAIRQKVLFAISVTIGVVFIAMIIGFF